MSRKTTAVFIAILLSSSILTIQYTSAISTPTVPNFTIKQVDRSYDAPTTYTTNPYTGETITHQGYYVSNLTIEVTIKNQPIPTSSNGYNTTGLFYNVQAKNHMDDWSSAYNDGRNKYTIKPASLEYTVVTFILNVDGLSSSPGSQVNIRVQAVTGTEYYVFSKGGGILPIGTQFILDEASSWSSIQTITVGSGEVTTGQSTPTSLPSQSTSNSTTTHQETNTNPKSEPQYSWELVVIVVMAVVIAALVAALVLSRRKKQ